MPWVEEQTLLPSWADGNAKRAILAFIKDVTTDGCPKCISVDQRIATFDNDDTLWCEQPTVQFEFAVARLNKLLPNQPEWKDRPDVRAILARDRNYFERHGEQALVDLVIQTHMGMTQEAFAGLVKDFLAEARTAGPCPAT